MVNCNTWHQSCAKHGGQIDPRFGQKNPRRDEFQEFIILYYIYILYIYYVYRDIHILSYSPCLNLTHCKINRKNNSDTTELPRRRRAVLTDCLKRRCRHAHGVCVSWDGTHGIEMRSTGRTVCVRLKILKPQNLPGILEISVTSCDGLFSVVRKNRCSAFAALL